MLFCQIWIARRATRSNLAKPQTFLLEKPRGSYSGLRCSLVFWMSLYKDYPQGSIGGPILWLIFTCDLPDVIHNHCVDIKAPNRGCAVPSHGIRSIRQSDVGCGVMVGYVDDGAYSFAHNDPYVLSRVLSEKYAKLADWMNENKLVSNSDKTQLVVMGKRKQNVSRELVSMIAGGHVIKPSETGKLLGAQLHQNMDWRVHLRDHKASLLNQLLSRINGLRKVCVHADFQTRLMVANGVVISKLTYLITLWGGASQYLINMLQVQQMTAARYVCGAGCWRWSRRRLLARVGWLSVRQLVFYHTVIQVHKTLNSGVPEPLFNSLLSDYQRVTRNAAAGNLRQVGKCSSTFRWRAVQFYNRVPVDVRSGSLDTVKFKLKRWVKENVPID